MDPLTMVVCIVAIVTLGGIIKRKHLSDRRPGEAGQAGGADEAESRRLREEVRTLKERVAVLERVITDDRGSRDLAHEIEALRSRDA